MLFQQQFARDILLQQQANLAREQRQQTAEESSRPQQSKASAKEHGPDLDQKVDDLSGKVDQIFNWMKAAMDGARPTSASLFPESFDYSKFIHPQNTETDSSANVTGLDASMLS